MFLYKYVCCDLLVFSGGFVVLMMKKSLLMSMVLTKMPIQSRSRIDGWKFAEGSLEKKTLPIIIIMQINN